MLGIDIMEIKEFERRCLKNKGLFLRHIFTADEISSLLKEDLKEAARYFAAKEAVSKALRVSVFNWRNIEIKRKKDGRKTVSLHNELKEEAHHKGIKEIQLDIASCKDYVLALAIANF